MAQNTNVKFNYGSEQLQKDAGSVSMFTALGTTDDVDHVILNDSGNLLDKPKINKVSGIARIDYEMVPGISKDGASAINMAAKKLYTFVRHVNSGSRNYDSPDLVMYCYSVISTYAFIAACERVYGIIKEYSCKNRYYAKAIVQSMGFDYDSIILNLADFRLMLNIAISKLNTLKVPSYWTIWTKEWYLNLAMFKDGDVDKSQIYYYRMRHAWKYNESGTYVGSLTPVDLYSASLDVTAIQSTLDTLINALVASEDINIMSGDILKAYGDNVINMPLISEDFTVLPIYDRDALELIHNTTCYALNFNYSANAGFIIRQDQNTNSIIFNPVVNTSGIIAATDSGNTNVYAKGESEYLNFFRDDIGYKDIVSASAMTLIHHCDNSGTKVEIDSCGTEFPTATTIFSLPNSGVTLDTKIYHRFEILSTMSLGITDAATMLDECTNQSKFLNNLTKFDWAPRCLFSLGFNGAGGGEQVELFDLYNFTAISRSDVNKLHDLHVLAGFGLAE